jgi:imidazole glycerol-phosphate synthase subunit HisH
VIARGRPFLGICVGMQLLATRGLEYRATPGLGWIPGTVERIAPADPALKVPHMGWNDLVIDQPHPVLDGLPPAITPISCIPTSSTSTTPRICWRMSITPARSPPSSGGQHPRHPVPPGKSQAAGLRLIANFLRWSP